LKEREEKGKDFGVTLGSDDLVCNELVCDPERLATLWARVVFYVKSWSSAVPRLHVPFFHWPFDVDSASCTFGHFFHQVLCRRHGLPPARRADAREPMPPSIPDNAQEVYERSAHGTQVFLISSAPQRGVAARSCLSTRSTTASSDPWTARDSIVPSSNRSPSMP
jgi:hypothetical protein